MFEREVLGSIYYYLISDVSERLASLPCRLIPPTVRNDLVQSAFLPLLRRVWERLLLVEMNLAEAEGLLEGKTSEDRFEFFATEVIKPKNFSVLLEKYKGLMPRWRRQLHCLAGSLELLLSRVDSDIVLVAADLYEDYGEIIVTKIELVGDPHRRQQQTARIFYKKADNITRAVYYKPRSLAVDVGLVAFFAWWNQHAPIDHFIPKALQKNGYGWTCAAEWRPCDCEDEVRAYYRRYGSLIALTHIFGSKDLHCENIVAAGPYPVIVDNETMFSGRLQAWRERFHLYSSLLLPVHHMSDFVEISPLMARGGMETDAELLVNPQRRESDLRLEPKRMTTRKYGCEAWLRDVPIEDFSAYDTSLIDGTRETMRFIFENADNILEKLKDTMNGASVRMLVRATETYAKVLRNSWHPDAMIHGEEQCEFLKLCGSSMDADITASELDQLQVGDIPYFEMMFESLELIDDCGQILPVDVRHSPIENVEMRLACLTSDSAEDAITDLRYALTAYRLRRGDDRPAKGRTYGGLCNLSHADWFDALARTTLDRVLSDALLVDGEYLWRTLITVGNGDVKAGLTGDDLYDGVAGLALAFYLAGLRLKEERYLRFAETLANQVADNLNACPGATWGALKGSLGSLWAVSFIRQEKLMHLLPCVQTTLSKLCFGLLSKEWKQYDDLDYTSGASGTLGMLLRLHDLYHKFSVAREIQTLATLVFERIVAFAISLRDDETSLGYAHGTAGVSAMLAQYMKKFGEHDGARSVIVSNLFRETALRTDRGWPRFDTDRTESCSWCHGTNGIGFSRIELRRYMTDDAFVDDMNVVISRIGDRQRSLGVCHGMMADYYLVRALGSSGSNILARIRHQSETGGITTNFDLNDFEIVGAMTGVTSFIAGAAILSNTTTLF
ncbi:type 2 lanthipeptide synthetase LanM [Brucella sp. NBRC 12950]|uniref:type 2 lanthipeptide synthetase LanM n=1 Tax=Brucella sp. NBRC 12950 TaxID=2994518 RepID=UPI0025532E74|nr:type 2 lanthipeptide synthetase LanM [Brucella sp. NBRC 12950]